MKTFIVYLTNGKRVLIRSEDWTRDYDFTNMVYFCVRQADGLSKSVAAFNWSNIYGIQELKNMTFKDCKNRRICTDNHKSYHLSDDGDSWANWCDHFRSRHKPISVEKDGYTAYQSGSDYHISITEKLTGQMVFHASCTKRVSKRALRRMIDQCSAEVFKRAFLELYHNGDLEL